MYNGIIARCENCGCAVRCSSGRVLCLECRDIMRRSQAIRRQWNRPDRPGGMYTVIHSGDGDGAYPRGEQFMTTEIQQMAKTGVLDPGMILEYQGRRYVAKNNRTLREVGK